MLSLLSHPNGLFGFISILLIYCACKFDFKKRKFKLKSKEITYFLIGPVLLLIPYLIYISNNILAFIGQFKANILNSTTSPLANILSESVRYQILFDLYKINSDWINLILILTISILLAILGLFYIIKNRNLSGKFLIITLLVHLVFFSILISQKIAFWYLGIILPYWTLLLAIAFKEKFNSKNYTSIILAILLVLYVLSNVFIISNIFLSTKDYDYRSIEYDTQKYIPTGQ